MENKIGTYATAASPIQWPDVTISGRSYRQPVSLMRGIGNGQFVVLDQPIAPNTPELIAELTGAKAKASKKVSDEQ